MVVCSCRNIRESQFTSREELAARILEEDHCCGKCLDEFLTCCGKKDIDTDH